MTTSRLQRELKKRDPFESPEQEALLNILRTSDQFHNRIGRLLREFGLTPSQYNVLRILRGAGTPLSCQEIASRLIQVVPALTGLLDRLERQQLLRRERAADDRRVVYVALSEPGAKLVARLDRPIRELHQGLLGHLKPSELASLSRLLEKARRSLDSTP